ncbi:MAG: helix-turn-helix domain-containing protein [Candidatus Odinarchaeota archaeon]
MLSNPLQSLRYLIVMDSHTFSVEETSKKYGFCGSWIYELRRHYREEGITGLLPRSRAPKKPYKKVTPLAEHLTVHFKKKLGVQNVKVEALRLFTSTTIADVQKRLYRWRNWYNFHRKHMGIGNQRPAELFQPWHQRYGRSFLTDLSGKDFTMSTM